MRVTNSELRLLWVLALIIFLGGNFFGYKWLAKKQETLNLNAAELRADAAEAKVDLLETDKWTQRMAWIQAHEPTLGDEGEAKAAVLNFVVKGARDNKLEIMEQSPNDSQHGPSGTQVNVSVKVKGAMDGLVKWLTDLQKPDQFYAITSLSLRADEDQKSMVCTLQIARYFKDK